MNTHMCGEGTPPSIESVRPAPGGHRDGTPGRLPARDLSLQAGPGPVINMPQTRRQPYALDDRHLVMWSHVTDPPGRHGHRQSPSKLDTLKQCCFNVGPTSKTLAQL